MAKKDNNNSGETAERIVGVLFNRLNLTCRVCMLGDKWPITDIYVEIPHNSLTLFFFLQVKSTSLGYTPSNQLKVKVPKDKLNKFAKFRAPTYLVGVDMNDSKIVPNAFIAKINGRHKTGVSSIPATSRHKINKGNLLKLEKEIIDYWKNSPDKQKNIYKSNFELK